MTANNNRGLPQSTPSDTKGLAPLAHDSKYYFEDGSITFRVDDVLFKVHVSMLKLQSEDLESKLDIPPKHMGARCKGCPRMESPVLITGSKPSQFRNLMEIVYCPPPNKLNLIQPVENDESAWHNFVFYLDVATLSRRLGMVRLEEWAKFALENLVQTSARQIADGIPLSGDASPEEEAKLTPCG